MTHGNHDLTIHHAAFDVAKVALCRLFEWLKSFLPQLCPWQSLLLLFGFKLYHKVSNTQAVNPNHKSKACHSAASLSRSAGYCTKQVALSTEPTKTNEIFLLFRMINIDFF